MLFGLSHQYCVKQLGEIMLIAGDFACIMPSLLLPFFVARHQYECAVLATATKN